MAFNFDTIIGAMDETSQTVEKRQTKQREKRIRDIALEDKAARDASVVADQAQASRASTQKKQLEILGGINEQITKANEAIKLTDSQNPLDRIQLWMLQQSDPAYTRDGNLRRIEYYQAAAAAVGGMEEIKQAGFSDQLNNISRDVELAKMEGAGELELLQMSEDQGKERIQLYLDQQAAMAGLLSNQVSMQQNALTQLPTEGVDSAIEEAKKSKDKKASVGGVMVPLSMLEERKTALEDRSYLMEVRQSERAGMVLNNSTIADVLDMQVRAQKDGFVVKDGVKIPMARIEERAAALTSREYQAKLATYQLEDLQRNTQQRTDRKILETMSLPEIRDIVLNGGKDSEGNLYDAGVAREIYDQRRAVQDDRNAMDLAALQMGDPMTQVIDQKNYLESFRAPQGSALATAIDQQTRVMNTASGYLEKNAAAGDPTNAMIASQVLQGGRERVEEALEKTAKDMSGGDKDKESILRYTLRGQQVPQETLEAILQSRITGGKPTTEFLSKEANAAFVTTFYQAKTAIATQSPMLSDKDVETLAAQEAILAVKQQAIGGLTEDIFAQQTFDPSNPLNQVLGPQEFLMLMRQTDQRGIEIYKGARQLDDNGVQKAIDSGDPNLAATQAAQLMKELDKKKPGLGRAYMDWWMSDASQDFVRKWQGAKYSTATSTQQQTELGLTLPDVPAMMSTNAQLLQQGDQIRFQDEFLREHTLFSQFGADAGVKQAFLLEQDKNLTDTDKQVAFTSLIKPLLVIAEKEKMNATQATQFIESNLMSMQPADARVKAILKKVLAGRSGALKVVDDFAKAHSMSFAQVPQAYAEFAKLLGLGKDAPKVPRMEDVTEAFGWYKNLGL